VTFTVTIGEAHWAQPAASALNDLRIIHPSVKVKVKVRYCVT
jgi:hypothetical protein